MGTRSRPGQGVRLQELLLVADNASYTRGRAWKPSSDLRGRPLSPELKTLCPSHDDSVAKVTAAAKAAREAGVILPHAQRHYVRSAKASAIPE